MKVNSFMEAGTGNHPVQHRYNSIAIMAGMCMSGVDCPYVQEFNVLALVEYDSVDRPARRDPMEANRG